MSETKAGIHNFIRNDIEPQANRLIKEQKEGIGKLVKIMIELGKAIEKPDLRMLKLLSKALDAESPLIANRLSRTAKLLERLEGAETETDLDTDLKELEEITAKLSNLESKFKNNYTAIKEYQEKANKALDEITDVEGEAAEQWAAQEAWLRKQLDFAKSRLTDMQQLREQAKKAAANRDEKTLEDAISAGADLRDAKPTVKEIQDTFSYICEAVHPEKLSQELQNQFKRDRQKFQQMVDEITELSAPIPKIQEEIESMEAAPVDAKKVSTTLRIPSVYDAKVKKAFELELAATGKVLEAIMREIRMPMPAKDIIAKLEKANVV